MTSFFVRALQWIVTTGLVLFAWPIVMVRAAQDDLFLGNALANYFLFVVAPLYVMLFIRNYPSTYPFFFFVQRWCEVLQLSLVCSFWLALSNPVQLVKVAETDAEVETFFEIVWQRALPVWLGLNFSYLDRGPLSDVSFTAEGWRKSPTKNIFVVVLLSVAVGAYVWIATEHDGHDSYETLVLSVLVLGTLFQEACRMLTAGFKNVHVHHYYVGLVAGVLCWGTHPFSLFLAHLFWGVYIEGVAAWGRDPTFLTSS